MKFSSLFPDSDVLSQMIEDSGTNGEPSPMQEVEEEDDAFDEVGNDAFDGDDDGDDNGVLFVDTFLNKIQETSTPLLKISIVGGKFNLKSKISQF